jgi:hypothetical protein
MPPFAESGAGMPKTERVRVYVANAVLCGIAPGAPIDGCDPPHPASIAAAAQALSAKRLNAEGSFHSPTYDDEAVCGCIFPALPKAKSFGARLDVRRAAPGSAA